MTKEQAAELRIMIKNIQEETDQPEVLALTIPILDYIGEITCQ